MRTVLLIVDDDEDVGAALAKFFQHKSIFSQVLVAADLRSAIGVLRSVAVDAVLCDYNLGDDLTGEHLLASVALMWPHVRRVLHSGMRFSEPVPWAHAVVAKPSDPADLILALVPSLAAAS